MVVYTVRLLLTSDVKAGHWQVRISCKFRRFSSRTQPHPVEVGIIHKLTAFKRRTSSMLNTFYVMDSAFRLVN